jgi:hypothetical protein
MDGHGEQSVWTEALPLLDFLKEYVMPSPGSKTRARTELIDLIESQLNILEKETFGCITEAELCEYEDRRDRICQLYAEIIDRETAA